MLNTFKIKRHWAVFPFLNQPLESQTQKLSKTDLLLYVAPPLEKDRMPAAKSTPTTPPVRDLIMSYPQGCNVSFELGQLFARTKWEGPTRPHITLSPQMKSQFVLPMKKEIIKVELTG